jgi:hypothetical protein
LTETDRFSTETDRFSTETSGGRRTLFRHSPAGLRLRGG